MEKPRLKDVDANSVGSDSETSVSGTSVSESFYCMYDDQEETDQSESTDDVDDEKKGKIMYNYSLNLTKIVIVFSILGHNFYSQ